MNPLFRDVEDLARSLSALARRAVAEYAPVVDAIIRDQTRDVHHIERTLDGLLDFCFDPEALRSFKELCRYYYTIEPAAAAFYVRAYREMWDSEPEAQP
jgi:hypothetical protein